jgi:hypothetical protein
VVGWGRPESESRPVSKLKRHLSVANVLSCIALFVALGGTAFAAVKLGAGQVKTVNIARQAVTNAKIKTQAVTSGKIKNGGVNALDLGAGQVTSEKIATGAVTGKKIAKKAVSPRTIAEEAITTGKLGNESVVASKISASLYAQLVKNVTYINSESASNNEVAKSAEAVCPTGKQAIGGGARVNGTLQDVAITGSNPASSGTTRTGWQAFARDVDNVPGGNWSVEAFVVCAEL